MSEIYVTKIRTESGDALIDYTALANKPESDTTLSKSGEFADAQTTGVKIDGLESRIDIIEGAIFGTSDEVPDETPDESPNGLTTQIRTLFERVDELESSKVDNTGDTISGSLTISDGDLTIGIGNIIMNDAKITGLGTPTDNTDAVTKLYVDECAANLTSNIGQISDVVYNNLSKDLDALEEEVDAIYAVPESTADDNGKFLRVVDGIAAWVIVPNAEESGF